MGNTIVLLTVQTLKVGVRDRSVSVAPTTAHESFCVPVLGASFRACHEPEEEPISHRGSAFLDRIGTR